MHKVPQHMQTTIAQGQQRREKATWNPQFHCARRSRIWFHAKAAPPATVAHVSQLFSATEPLFTQKHNVSCKSSHSNRILDVAVPMQSAKMTCKPTQSESQLRCSLHLCICFYSALLYFSSTLLCSTLLCSTLLCSTLHSTLLYSSLLYSTLTLLYSTLLYPTLYYSTLLLHAGANWTQCWASENVTSWSPKAHANWTQWSLG